MYLSHAFSLTTIPWCEKHLLAVEWWQMKANPGLFSLLLVKNCLQVLILVTKNGIYHIH